VKANGRQNRARKPVQIVANQHRGTVMIAHVFRKPEFLSLIVCFDLNDTSTSAVVRRDEDAICTRDRCRYVGDVVCRSSILPQQTTILRVEPNCPFRREEHHLRRAIYFHRNSRRITCLIALTLPNQCAVSL